MRLLAIDTSTLTAGVCAFRNGKVLAERRERVTTHSADNVTMDRGKTMSTLEVDIQFPNAGMKAAAA